MRNQPLTNRKAKVSICDIARIAGVSKSTVSLVMNGKGIESRISKLTIEKILKSASDLGYQPDSFAQSLRTGKSGIIGFLVDDISNPFFSDVARVLEKKALDHGYSMLISCFGKKGERAGGVIKVFKDRSVEGYVVAAIPGLEDYIRTLIAFGKPVVLFDRYFPGLDANYVVTDNFGAVYDATLHLIEQGFSNICFVTTESAQQELLERLNGYTGAIQAASRRAIVLELANGEESAKSRQLADFIRANSHVGAFIFASGMLMKTALNLARENKLDFLQTKGVVCFDDFDILSHFSPSVTAISQSAEGTGDRIIKILGQEFSDGSSITGNTSRIAKIKADLIIRESTLKVR